MRVSVLLPNLNNRNFIEERLETIINQTYTDWELIIVDNFSDDGAWEIFMEYAKTDKRIKISQAPRKGLYANWNNCIRLAQGEFIYIATSDDTMEVDFLTKMVESLDKHPECGIAHCCLTIIDEKGKNSEKNWDGFQQLRYFNNEVSRYHIRYAPLDGILHATVGMIYTSITQLLIRKKVFDTVGNFLTEYGSTADFEWEMRASLIFNTIHVPEYLATWRVHKDQATNDTLSNTSVFQEKFTFFITHAIESNKEKGLLKIPINIKKLVHNNNWLVCRLRFKETTSVVQKSKLVVNFFLEYPFRFIFNLTQKLTGSKPEDKNQAVKKIVKEFNLNNNVRFI